MDNKKLVPAQLDENSLNQLQHFEQTLHDTTGQEIIIVAYQAEDPQNNQP